MPSRQVRRHCFDNLERHFKKPPEQKACRDIVTTSITISQEASMGRGILLWLLGVPIPIIILIMLFAR
ncbi:hypothetical protein DPM35_16450 [Mesorhizobium atlanticum]|uniref:Uncharacterized protein n=2 Tax=Mesorhizobium TaxID=68287 RepID=A0A330GRZ9_9HYPH|nr:hypothetical protein DPM35_16450 [Mesorhizobium atlanticum]